MLADALAQEIFEGRHCAFQAEFTDWLSESRRFRTFAEIYASKIRKKLRLARDDESLIDLRCELETAYRLLQEKRFTLEYEKYGAVEGRGPDLTVTYRTHTLLNVEVTRPRMAGETVDKLMETLCVKVGQMSAGMLNLLVFYAKGTDAGNLDHAGKTLRSLAEHKDEAFFTRRRFKTAKDFLRLYQNLSAAALLSPGLYLWNNPLAKKPLPDDLRKAIQKSL